MRQEACSYLCSCYVPAHCYDGILQSNTQYVAVAATVHDVTNAASVYDMTTAATVHDGVQPSTRKGWAKRQQGRVQGRGSISQDNRVRSNGLKAAVAVRLVLGQAVAAATL